MNTQTNEVKSKMFLKDENNSNEITFRQPVVNEELIRKGMTFVDYLIVLDGYDMKLTLDGNDVSIPKEMHRDLTSKAVMFRNKIEGRKAVASMTH